MGEGNGEGMVYSLYNRGDSFDKKNAKVQIQNEGPWTRRTLALSFLSFSEIALFENQDDKGEERAHFLFFKNDPGKEEFPCHMW